MFSGITCQRGFKKVKFEPAPNWTEQPGRMAGNKQQSRMANDGVFLFLIISDKFSKKVVSKACGSPLLTAVCSLIP